MMGRGALLLPLLLTVGMVAAGPAVAAPKHSNRIRPASNAGVVKILVGKKTGTYHTATKLKPVEFRVKGPIGLRVLSRYLFPASGSAKATPYHLRLDVDGVAVRTEAKQAGVSTRASVTGGGKVGTLEKTILRLPTGSHTVRIVPTEDGATVALRILKGTGKRSAIKWVSFQPETYMKALRLLGKDAETTVYRFSPAQPLGLSIIGPLKLNITTRLDFGTTNGYTQAYVIKTSLDSKPWKSFPFKARSSHTVSYPDMTEVTPGQGRSFILDVPAGSHKIALALDGTTAAAASAAVQVPQKHVKAGQ